MTILCGQLFVQRRKAIFVLPLVLVILAGCQSTCQAQSQFERIFRCGAQSFMIRPPYKNLIEAYSPTYQQFLLIIQPGDIPVEIYDQNLSWWFPLTQPQQPVSILQAPSQNQSNQTVGGNAAPPPGSSPNPPPAAGGTSGQPQTPQQPAPIPSGPLNLPNNSGDGSMVGTIIKGILTPIQAYAGALTLMFTILLGICRWWYDIARTMQPARASRRVKTRRRRPRGQRGYGVSL